MKLIKKEVKLTPARAMLLYALFKYERFGEYSTVLIANKIMYFLQQLGEDLKLQFDLHTYGPRSLSVEKVLYALNGKYFTRLEQMKIAHLGQLKLDYSKYDEIKEYIDRNLKSDQKQRLSDLFKVIEGFESAFSLEILSLVHFIRKNNPSMDKKEVLNKIYDWYNSKKTIINDYHVGIAFEQLENYRRELQLI